MSAAVAATHPETELPEVNFEMKGPFVASFVLHVVVAIIAVLGLPFLTPDPPVIEEHITVEIVDASDVPVTKRVEPEAKKQPPKNDSPTPPKPVMPKVMAKTPPKPAAPKPPPVDEFKAPEKIPEPIEKPEPVKAMKPAKPLKKPVLTKAEEEPQEDPFKSLLKNLTPEEQEKVDEVDPKSKTDSPLTKFSQQMSMYEMQALQAQLSQCWSVMAGARYAEDIIVEIKLFMNPDRTIRDAKIVNQLRYTTDGFFKAAADGALRAVYKCSPLDVPPNKYDLWKTITVTFDPRTML